MEDGGWALWGPGDSGQGLCGTPRQPLRSLGNSPSPSCSGSGWSSLGLESQIQAGSCLGFGTRDPKPCG